MPSVVLKGLHEFEHAIDRIRAMVDTATRDATAEITRAMIEEARAGINSQSGTLADSIHADTTRVGFGVYEATVGPGGVEYARKVELGKQGKHSAAPHPYLQPAERKVFGTVNEVYARAWAGAIRRG